MFRASIKVVLFINFILLVIYDLSIEHMYYV